MKLLSLLLLALLWAVPVSAQSTGDVVFWPASTPGGYSATLKGRQNTNKTLSASEILSDLCNHKFEILRRDTHQTIVEPGQQFFVLIVKVQRK